MQRKTWIAVGLGGVTLAVATAFWLLRPPAVPAMKLQTAPLVRTLQFSARIATPSRVDVGSTLTGRVLEVTIAEGAQVKKGDVLVRLESDELRAALAQAKASERQAAARLIGLKSSVRSSAQALVAQADSVLAAAQADLKRTRELVAQGFVSPARLDEAERNVAVAKAQQAGAQAQRSATNDQGADVVQAQAQQLLASAAIAAAQARLDQTTVRAPADALVLVREVEPGQIVQPGRTLLSLALTGPPQLVAQADERFLESLQVGQPAMVMADAFAGQRFAAHVQSIAPLVDAQKGAVEVKLSVATPAPAFLREDMTLSVEVETARRDVALVVPAMALRSDPSADRPRVWIEQNGRVEARAVRLGLRTADAAEVLEGVRPGDLVLLGPSPLPGRRVRADVNAVPPAGAKASREDAGSAMTNAMGR